MAVSSPLEVRKPEGLIIVDKEAGWTSHDVVARCRKLLCTRKVGHSGTLDPDATGVLVLGVGRATRLLRFLSGLTKEYIGQVVLGTETSTLDASGEVTGVHEMTKVTLDQVAAAAGELTGEILQVPPMVSAVKIGGRRLYEIARDGGEIERPPRSVTVFRFDVAPTDELGVYDLAVCCSSGTYIRTLAADLGSALGGGAHLRRLRRTAVGSFTLAEANPLADAGPLESPALLPIAEALRDFSGLTVDDGVALEVSHGRPLDVGVLSAELDEDDIGPWPVYGPAGQLLAVYEPHTERPGWVKPSMVLASAPS